MNHKKDILNYDDIVNDIYNNKKFKQLISQKQRFSLLLLSLTLGLYILLILLVALAPDFIGKPISEDMIMLIGIPLGFFLIIWTIGMTAYYVYKTNCYYDPMTEKIIKEIVNEIQ